MNSFNYFMLSFFLLHFYAFKCDSPAETPTVELQTNFGVFLVLFFLNSAFSE